MYELTSDEKLRELAARPDDLTSAARDALDAELKKRKLLEPPAVEPQVDEPPLAGGATPCADHPLRAVVGVCTRCGRFICYRCDGDVGETLTALAPNPPTGMCGPCRALVGMPPKPLPIGGWLILTSIGLVLSPITHVRSLYQTLEFFRASSLSSLGSGLVLFDMFYSVAFLALSLWTAVRFFGKRTDAPKLVIAIFAAGVAQMFMELGFENILAGEVLWSASNTPGELVGTVGRAAIWIPYFRMSKRVKQTFVRP